MKPKGNTTWVAFVKYPNATGCYMAPHSESLVMTSFAIAVYSSPRYLGFVCSQGWGMMLVQLYRRLPFPMKMRWCAGRMGTPQAQGWYQTFPRSFRHCGRLSFSQAQPQWDLGPECLTKAWQASALVEGGNPPEESGSLATAGVRSFLGTHSGSWISTIKLANKGIRAA